MKCRTYSLTWNPNHGGGLAFHTFTSCD
ncbi:unnamed protein product [Timema podura]|uniref:Uncharacterized protein n=1 Tax=Timema podura TaxID=61482 RepID=A0ABN7PI62_TIMPD|nr:unnamed protein product [Timema podura]